MQSDWDIVKRGWDANVLGQAPNHFTDPVDAIKTLRVSCAPRAILCLWNSSTEGVSDGGCPKKYTSEHPAKSYSGAKREIMLCCCPRIRIVPREI